jgi:hypothetical protein
VSGERREAVGGAGVLDGVVEDRSKVGGIGDERLALEPLERNRVGVGERVGSGEHRDERLGVEHLGAELALADRGPEEREIERAVQEP